MPTDNSKEFTRPVFKLNVPDDSYKFQPLPSPHGQYPYRLNVEDLITPPSSKELVFHMVGDTGSSRQPQFQRMVARLMVQQFNESSAPAGLPLFLFHLGDVVYHFGEAEEYNRQFFEPYKNYPAPIFAIAGNHDSDINPNARVPYKSLDAFMRVFCDYTSRNIPFANNAGRLSMVQPNIYYTLQTPLATIIALYSNVPKFGAILPEQRDWFINELKHAAQPGDKAIIVCVHHAPFSADSNHGSSRFMINFLESAYQAAGVWPDIVFNGHVHNYQRFTRRYANGKSVPYIVAGAGGYVTLFPLTKPDILNYTDLDPLLDNVTLNSYCDDKYGFLKVRLLKDENGIQLTVEYYTIPLAPPNDQTVEAMLFDSLTMRLDR